MLCGFITFTDFPDNTVGGAKGLRIYIDKKKWRKLPRWEKISLVSHELRHVWQHAGMTLAPMLVLAILASVPWALTSQAVLLPVMLACSAGRWLYVAVRSEQWTWYAELDAVKFEYHIASLVGYRRQLLADRTKSPIGMAWPEYQPAMRWLKKQK